MKMRWLYGLLAAVGVLAVLLAITQFVMAICFMELGRVIFYLVITVLSAEVAVLSILKLRKVNTKSE